MEDRIVANVNGEIILLSEVKKQIALLKGFSEKKKVEIKPGELADENILNSMIDEKIMAHYARENNVVIKESAVDKSVEKVKQKSNITDEVLSELLKREGMTIKDYRKKIKNQMMIRQIMSLEVPSVEISDEEAKSYYKRNKAKFIKPGKVRAAHIIILLGADGAREAESKKKIEQILKEIQGGADFALMAKANSEDGAAKDGGDLGWFTRGKMLPAFEKLAFSLKKGEVGGPVKTKYGYHLIKVLDITNPEPTPYAEVVKNIKNRLKAEAYQKKSSAWIERLRSQAYIEILY